MSGWVRPTWLHNTVFDRVRQSPALSHVLSVVVNPPDCETLGSAASAQLSPMRSYPSHAVVGVRCRLIGAHVCARDIWCSPIPGDVITPFQRGIVLVAFASL